MKFKIKITGISEGLDINLVAEKFASLFKIDEKTAINVIFKNSTIRHDIEENIAYKYKEALENIGVQCRIEKMHAEKASEKTHGNNLGNNQENRINVNQHEFTEKTKITSACPYCAEEIKPNATICPHCKQAIFSKKPLNNAAISIIAFIVAFFIIYNAITSFVNHEADKEYNRIMDKVERDMRRLTPWVLNINAITL